MTEDKSFIKFKEGVGKIGIIALTLFGVGSLFRLLSGWYGLFWFYASAIGLIVFIIVMIILIVLDES